MAEVNALILPIGANASSFEKSINDVKSRIKELVAIIKATPFNLVKPEQLQELGQLEGTLKRIEQQVKETGKAFQFPENSIQGLTQKINELNNKKIILDAKTSAAEIARINKEIDELSQKRSNLENLGRSVSGVSPQFSKLADSSKNARTAVTSLNLIVQDLPFGFIAIQNNLPALFQTFNQLKSSSEGVGGALKSIGQQLVGPAGIFLAFTSLTSVITLLIQKYGSLDIAIDAFLGKQTQVKTELLKSAEAIKEYNKEFRTANQLINDSTAATAGNIQRVKALSEIVLNQSKSFDERNLALNELKKIDDTYFGNLDIQKTTYKDLSKAVTLYNNTLKQTAASNRLQERINKDTVELERQKETLELLSNNLNQLKSAPIKIVGAAAARQDLEAINEAQSLFNAQQAVVKQLESNIANLKVGLTETINTEIALKAPVEAANTLLEQQSKGLKKVGETLNETDKDWEKFLELTAKSNQRLAEYYATQLKLQADKNLQNKLKADAEAYKLLEKALYDVNEANAQFGIETLKTSSIIDTRYAQSIIDSAGILNRFRDAQFKGANAFEVYKEQIKNFEDLKSSIENNLTKPFRDFFDELLTNGKVSFEGFVQLAKDAFKRILAQAIASGIANLLANLLSGGVAQIAQAKIGAAGGVAKALTSFGGIFGLRREAAPSFGGIQGGVLQLAAAVNFELRGSDLVGSINRTNSTIGRIG
jgi:chromosome segregation ATPase